MQRDYTEGRTQPRRHAGRVDGAALREAQRRKERTYPELLRSQRCRLVKGRHQMHWLRAKENHEAERSTDHMVHSRSALHSAGGTFAHR